MNKSATITYRKNSFEARMDALLPEWPWYDVVVHDLWRNTEGGWSVNDSWHMASGCNREEAISHLRHRWEIFRLNYLPKAAIRDITDIGDEDVSLEVDCTAFAEVRNGLIS